MSERKTEQQAERWIAASDHAGVELRLALVERLRASGAEVEDLGASPGVSVDYPDMAAVVARRVSASWAGDGAGADGGARVYGLLCCGTGQGMAMVANRVPGVRAAVLGDCFSARSTREHNDANVICLGQRVVGAGLAADILDAFRAAAFAGGRHAGRVAKIHALERP